MVEAFLALESMMSIGALVGGRALLGFIWLLLSVSTVLYVAAFEDCRSIAFVGG